MRFSFVCEDYSVSGKGCVHYNDHMNTKSSQIRLCTVHTKVISSIPNQNKSRTIIPFSGHVYTMVFPIHVTYTTGWPVPFGPRMPNNVSVVNCMPPTPHSLMVHTTFFYRKMKGFLISIFLLLINSNTIVSMDVIMKNSLAGGFFEIKLWKFIVYLNFSKFIFQFFHQFPNLLLIFIANRLF